MMGTCHLDISMTTTVRHIDQGHATVSTKPQIFVNPRSRIILNLDLGTNFIQLLPRILISIYHNGC